MSRRPRIVLEITPPRKANPGVLLRRARSLGPRVDAVNVIQRPDRMTSLEASLLLADANIPAVWHLASRGRSAAEIRADLGRAALGALPAVLCMLGDHGAEDLPSGLTIRECVALARAALPEARVGVTLNPYVPGERVWKNLLGKLEAGADFVQTQPIFEPERLAPFAQAIRRSFPEVAVLPMAMPLDDAATARRVAERLGISVPPAAVGTTAFTRTLRALARDPLYSGVAIMTPRMDPEANTVRDLRAALATL